MRSRVRALELRAEHGYADQITPARELEATEANEVLVGGSKAVDVGHSLYETQGESLLGVEGDKPAMRIGGTTPIPGSPKWSQVVKRGLQQHRQPVAIKPASHSGNPTLRWRKAVKTIVGTGAAGNIKMVKTKLVSVFASKFYPDVDTETLRAYLEGKLGHDVTCQKITTVNNRYASFKVSAECSDVAVMYNPELWPEGTFVRRYYEQRKAGIGANVPLSTGVLSVPAAGVSTNE